MRRAHRVAGAGALTHLDLERRQPVLRPAPGRDGDRVRAPGFRGGPGVAREPGARCAGEAPALRRRDRSERILHATARFHLHEGDGIAAPHHEVDLAAGRRKTAGERAVAFGEEEQGCDGFGRAAAPIGDAAALGRGNPWHLYDAYLDGLVDHVTEDVVPRWVDRLGGADVFTDDNAYIVLQSLRLDR